MPVRQVGTQATWKTKRDHVTLPPMGPIGGKSVNETRKLQNCSCSAIFNSFLSIPQPLNSMECLCLLDRWVPRLHGKHRDHVTSPCMGTIGGNSINKTRKLQYCYCWFIFNIFFSVSQPLNSMKGLWRLDRWIAWLHGKHRDISSHYLVWGP